MDLTQIFNLSYLFNRYPPAGFTWPFRIALLIIFLAAIVLAIISKKKLKKVSGSSKRGWYKLQVWGWSTGIVGLLLMSFREVRALYISARAYLLLWLIIIFVWLIFILIYWKKVVPARESTIKDNEEFTKWLPKKK